VPEVGEWARYEITQHFIPDPGKRPESFEVIPGSLRVQCVGEETIEDQRHLWIELRWDMQPAEKFEATFISKVLVPEDELLLGELSAEDIRGWQQEDKSTPRELTFSADDLIEDSGGNMVRFLNAGALASTGQMSTRTITVNQEEFELTYAEHSLLPVLEYESNIMSGEITIWPADDLAFGVASMDFASLQTYVADSMPTETLNETRFDLVETGTGAVSDLPDHN
jgi:hypothetical protein